MSPDKVEVFYEYGISAVGRLHMLGRNNPQASKLLREIMLPTWDTIDLTANGDPNSRKIFFAAIAQHWDIKDFGGRKIHQMPLDQAERLVETYAVEQFEKSLTVISKYLDSTEEISNDDLDTIRQEFSSEGEDWTKKQLSPGALHALQEYARYKQGDKNQDLENFETALYLEADGVTDGPVNVMMHLGMGVGGRFTETWVKTMAKGGLSIGDFGDEGRPFAEHYARDPKDIYTEVKDALIAQLALMEKQIARDRKTAMGFKYLMDLMAEMIDEMKFDENNNIVISRGVTKSPVTVSIYGSGAKGIAGKITNEILEVIYERMSSSDIDSVMKLQEQISFLANHQAKSFEGKPYFKNAPVQRSKQSPKDYTFTTAQYKNLRSAVLQMFVTPMINAMESVLGEVRANADQLNTAIQVQSLFMQHQFQEYISEQLDQNQADGQVRQDLLTRRQIQQGYDQLKHLSPYISTGTQNFLIANFEQVDLRDPLGRTRDGEQPQAGSDYRGTFRSTAQVRGPTEAGVKAKATIAIGTGDGQMIQNHGANPNNKTGLPVFDGFNFAISDAIEGSRQINKAVFDGWMKNPLADISDSFSQFMANVDLTAMTSNEELRKAVSRAVDPMGGEDLSVSQIQNSLKSLDKLLQERSLLMQARHNVLARTTLSVDHMASASAPHVNKGQIVITATDPIAIAEELNQHFEKEVARLRAMGSGNNKVGEAKPEIAKELSNFGELSETFGTRTGGIIELRRMVRNMNIPAEHKLLLDETLKHLAGGDYRITVGTLEQINAERVSKGLFQLSSENDPKGFTLVDEQQIYLIGSTSETLAHELIHGATFDKVHAYYNNRESLSPEQRDAISRIEILMKQWIDAAMQAEAGYTIGSINPTVTALRNSLRAVNKHLVTGNEAAALNEFMAWNLANQALADFSRKIDIRGTLAAITTKVISALKQLIWGRAKAPIATSVGNDLLTNLRFNTAIVMSSVPMADKLAQTNAVLEHSTGNAGAGNTGRLQTLRDAFERKIGQTVTAFANPGDQDMRQSAIAQQLVNVTDVTKIFQAHGFPMSQLQASTFENIALAMMVDANLNPNALLRAQQLYASVMKTIKVEDFLADPDTANEADRYEAQEKLDTLRGLNGTKSDAKHRSSLLVGFMALAAVDDQFRSILSKMPVPKSEKNLKGTLDAALDNMAQQMMDRNNIAFSGEGRNAPSVQAAIDALFVKLTENKIDNANYVDQSTNKVREFVDTFNDFAVDSVQNVSAALFDKLDAAENAARNRLLASLARIGKAVVSVVNEDKSELVQMGITSALNQAQIPTIIREFWTEIVGRTNSNKTIYDMIKAVRTFVQQTRQRFREHLPKLISESFSRELKDHEWAAMTNGMARTGLASLAQNFNVTQLFDFIAKPASAQREINKLEQQLDAIDKANWPHWQQKAEQLADYMTHGTPGHNLLRNAESIANLFDEPLSSENRKALGTPSPATIAMIDQLVSLYALQRIDPAVAETLITLINDEAKGMTTVMSLLIGQHKDEMAKINKSGIARLNHFKAYVPTEQEAGVSLIVANDKEFSRLTKRGYVRVGAYEGAKAERRAPRRSYYYAPVSGRAMFMQGILQNVRATAYGVDPRTGIANGPATAGAITNTGMVDARLARMPLNDAEPLMPIRDTNGTVIGYERSMDPKIAAKLNHNDQMHEVIGIWHGRQAEEKMAGEFNDMLVERLGQQWKTERRTQKSEYVNLFSEEAQKDPIIADAVSLITQDVRENIESQFGRGQFWVRRDMINDALGYRSPSVTDLWTGISRWSPEVQNAAQTVALGIMGKDAYKMLVKAEQTLQTFVADAKVTIVVKSVVVPIANIMSNVYHLASRGVPLKNIIHGFTAKAAEVDFFIKNNQRRMELLALKRVAEGTNDNRSLHKIDTELRSILDANRRLSIWPLLEAGEFASISDTGISSEEIDLTEGRLGAYIEKLTDKLPDSLKTAAKYGLVSRDTSLFKGLQRSVEYGDFLAKAVLYEDLTGRKKQSHDKAMGQITEEFINYDRLPGRWRSGLENNGMMWFWNFKLRAAKVALSVLRNNPVHMFLAHLAPVPDFLGLDVGTVSTDNFVSILADNKEGYSLGLDQGLRAHLLNPFVNMGSGML